MWLLGFCAFLIFAWILLLLVYIKMGIGKDKVWTYEITTEEMEAPSSKKWYAFLLWWELPRKYLGGVILSKTWNSWEQSKRKIEISVNNAHIAPSLLNSLRSCFNDNDVEVISNKFVRSINHISPELEEMIAFYSILVGKLQLIGLANIHFPLPLLGAVHVSNLFSYKRRYLKNIPVDVKLTIHQFRQHKRGILFHLDSEVYQEKSLIWTCKTTFLSPITIKRDKTPFIELPGRRRSESILAEIRASPSEHKEPLKMKFPSTIGKRFAEICGDYNPIHISLWVAKLFGLRSCIAHGICALGKSVSQLKRSQIVFPITCEVYFVSPLFIPSVVSLESMNQEKKCLLDLSVNNKKSLSVSILFGE